MIRIILIAATIIILVAVFAYKQFTSYLDTYDEDENGGRGS